MSSDVVIKVCGLAKAYPLYDRPHHRMLELLLGGRSGRWRREHRALHPMDFSVRAGECVGIVGSNGSGKSTLLQILCGTLSASAGSVNVSGRVAALLELGAGFNPEFTGLENVHLNAALLGLTREQIHARLDRILAFADIGDFIDQPVRTYSSGMFVRLAFAVAIHVDPDVLIVDEALSVGDEAFQRKCFSRIEDMRRRGCTILFVSHASQSVVQLCDRALWLEAGVLRMDGSPRDVVSAYHRATLSGTAEIGEANGEASALEDPGPLKIDEQAGKDLAFSPALIAYDRAGGELLAARLSTSSGQDAGVLQRGGRYCFGYTLKIDRDVPEVRAGMMVRNRAGIELAGATVDVGRLLGRAPQRGDAVRIDFDFECLMYPGTYFLSCGAMCDGPTGEYYLHRLVDAFEVTVLPELSAALRTASPQGAVDLRFDARVRLTTAADSP